MSDDIFGTIGKIGTIGKMVERYDKVFGSMERNTRISFAQWVVGLSLEYNKTPVEIINIFKKTLNNLGDKKS